MMLIQIEKKKESRRSLFNQPMRIISRTEKNEIRVAFILSDQNAKATGSTEQDFTQDFL